MEEHSTDIHKSLELFSKAVLDIRNLMEEGKANFNIRCNTVGFRLREKPNHGILADLPESLLQTILNEVVDLTVAILNKNEDKVLDQVKNSDPDQVELVEKKISTVRENILTDKLAANYYFLNSCTSKVVRGLNAQPIVKPGRPGFTSTVSLIVNMEIDNNYYSEPKTEVLTFEINRTGLEYLAKGFNDLLELLKSQEEVYNDKNKD